MNPTEIFKQLSGMRARVSELQEELAAQEFVGEAGGGLVRVVINGKSEAKKITIDPSLSAEELSVIGDLVASAFNSAVRHVQSQQAGQIGNALGLGNLPGFPKL